MNLSKIIDRNSSRYDKYLCIGDFNSETSETALRNFCDLYKLKNLVREPTCFKNPDNPSCIDLLLTNCSRSFQDTQVIETGLSDFHKMNLTVLKMYFTKQKHETIFYRNYKTFDNLNFQEALNRELMKYDVNNIDYEIFHEIVLSILNAHAPLKTKHLRANHATFVAKEFRKAVMKRARLRNAYLKKRTEATKTAYNYQRNICVILLRKSKRSYFENVTVKLVRDNKKFWKNVAPLFSNKIKSKERITLTENENINSNDKKVAETFHEFFSNVVKTLNISQNPYLISGTSQTDPVLQSIEKFSKHPSIINIKERMNNSNYTFSFKFESQEKFSKLMQNFNCNKATQQYNISIKILKENSEIFSYILYHNFNNSLFNEVFPNSLKKADITPVFKKEEKFLKNNYRPVSILPNVSKIYEHCIYDQMNDYFHPLFQNCNVDFEKDLMHNTAY